WRTSDLFDAEQRLVIGYAAAVLAADVPDALSAAVKAAYGETGLAELTTIVAVWAAWAMIIEAMRPA
ncbi:MAG: carboxymuconolactone decarboxylase family protein, partial [Sphingomonas sp.]